MLRFRSLSNTRCTQDRWVSGKPVTDFLSCRNLTGGLGALRMVDFMRPVLAVSDGVIRSKEGGVPADFGDLSGPGGQEAVLVQKQRLYLLHVLQIDFMRADAVSVCHSRGFADWLPQAARRLP